MPTDRPASEDPRVERSRRVVHQAALEELAAVGYGGFTIDAVAARCGVARSTIYRHWPDKGSLIADAFEALNRQPRQHPDDDGGPRRLVVGLVHHLAEVMQGSVFSTCMPSLVDAAEHHDGVRAFVHTFSDRRRQGLVDAIASAVDAGEAAADVDPDLAAVALAGAIVYRRLLTGDRFDPDRADELVDLVLGPRPTTAEPRRGRSGRGS